MATINRADSSRTVRVTEGSLRDFGIHFNDIGSGPVVVMLHGSGPGATSWGNFSRNIEPVVNAGFRVLLLDQPGWGGSDPIVIETGSRAKVNAQALKGTLDALDIGRASLIGNSMGGNTALQFALDYPDRCDKVILMGGGGGIQSLFVPMPPEGIKLIGAVYRSPTVENLKKMLDVFVFDTSQLTPELIDGRYKAMHERPEHLKNFVKSMDVNPKHQVAQVADRLHEIKAKTLVVWGRDDRFVPMDSSLRLLWGMPDAQVHLFPRCGHWAQWEHAEAFNRLTVDFLTH